MRAFLKGGKYLGDAAWAQDETGYNYREMYQMATIHGDAPANTNLELVLDASSLHLLGTSEAGTGKTLDFTKNANVSISWCRQLREEEETTYNYYCSYGIQYNGKVRVYTLDDLNTTEGQDALINLCDKYYPTLASSWAAYDKGLADVTDAAALREAKLAYNHQHLAARLDGILRSHSRKHCHHRALPDEHSPHHVQLRALHSTAGGHAQVRLYPVPERELSGQAGGL